MNMTTYNIYSWNVNGIRAASKKGLLEWIQKEKIDVLGIQEIKAMKEQVDENIISPNGFESAWHSAEKKGYSGVLTYYKKKLKPIIEENINIEEFDREGRIIKTKFEKFTLLNVYFPNGKKNDERLDYKMRFYDEFLKYCLKLRKEGERVIICGDVNTAHKEIDLARPTKQNKETSGFLPKERKWIDKFIENGYIDTFRHIHGDKEGQYSWWSVRSKTARENNVGWRIDYFFIDKELLPNLKDALIHPNVTGSDHSPISIELIF